MILISLSHTFHELFTSGSHLEVTRPRIFVTSTDYCTFSSTSLLPNELTKTWVFPIGAEAKMVRKKNKYLPYLMNVSHCSWAMAGIEKRFARSFFIIAISTTITSRQISIIVSDSNNSAALSGIHCSKFQLQITISPETKDLKHFP